jgi:hypothetical protein
MAADQPEREKIMIFSRLARTGIKAVAEDMKARADECDCENDMGEMAEVLFCAAYGGDMSGRDLTSVVGAAINFMADPPFEITGFGDRALRSVSYEEAFVRLASYDKRLGTCFMVSEDVAIDCTVAEKREEIEAALS